MNRSSARDSHEVRSAIIRAHAIKACDSLRKREVEVLSLIGYGLTHAQIAVELGIEIKTVKHHVTVLKKRVGIKDRGDMIRLALKAGLATLWVEHESKTGE